MAAPASPKPGIGRAVVVPASLAALVLGLLGLFLSTFLGDTRTLGLGLGAAWIAFATGRVLAHLDLPRGRGTFFRHVLSGIAVGFAGLALLLGLFAQGPGWPWTPWWVLLGGFGFGLFRSHRALLRQAREGEDKAPRWLGVFHPKDLEALAALVVGWGLVGLSGFLLFRAFSVLLPGAGRMLALGGAIYGLQTVRYLLAFASEDRAAQGAGVVGWLKAHALQNAIVVLVLVAYAIFRDDLARSLPFFPLVEFGLGVAVFGFVLARLRARLAREGTPLATASAARDHARVVTELREADFDQVARPVTRFVETGLGQAEYAGALASTLPPDDPRALAVSARLAQHREPPRPPSLALPWALAAGAATTLGVALAGVVASLRVFDATWPAPLLVALLVAGFGAYSLQDVARAHFRPWLGLGLAATGTGILFLDLLLFLAQMRDLAAVPGAVWGVAAAVAATLVAIPAFLAWRQARRLREGQVAQARRMLPSLEIQHELQRARKRAATMLLAAIILLLPLPWLADALAARSLIPSGFPPFLDDVLASVLWAVAGLGGSALVRFYGLTRARPKVLARERAGRERRLAIHQDLMRTLEKV